MLPEWVSGCYRNTHIRGFFSFLFEETLIPENPTIHLKKPKLEKKLPIYLTVEECHRFIDIVRRNSINRERNVTIIALFLYTGMRLSELTGLDIHDLDMSNQIIRVFGKGRKERLIPILAPLLSSLKSYLDYRKGILGADCYTFSPLFFTAKNQTWKESINVLFMRYS
ncbi:tyrosine-type recombinase/integrase [Paenibacillus sp. GP183]|uniref:tyrosine-type recombinase/integrase n=1 Tax=Paenibacillus sp. GP183 TaxID=1882751 RepID=UPI000AB2C99C|nr:tyrosine-type recombinase/integrase [Paenibacillus sp. GP183]